tara:strand:+ start:3131 stop:3580 length:450 start_codon:yes stop_codon:yes gene_type:complete
MEDVDWLRRNFVEVFCLPEEATEWLIDLYRSIQLFDDVADGDTIDRKELDHVLWHMMVGQYSNAFFAQKSAALVPLLANAILKWQASDHVEREGDVDARSFMWRAGYYDIILSVIQLCHGHEVAKERAHIVMRMYGEKYEDYLEEFIHA